MIVFHRHLLLTSLSIVLCAFMIGCAQSTVTQGNMLDEARISKVAVGESTKEDVAAILGSPSAVGTFDDAHWYYIGRQSQKTAFFDPELKDQQIIMISFNDDGVVTEVKKTGLEEVRDISPVARSTPTSGQEVTVMKQLLGNVGRFNKDRKIKNPSTIFVPGFPRFLLTYECARIASSNNATILES
ncbi:MAG: outer membrane protein assembly factor BamE [Alphaproteobacteria bacterium]